MLSGVSFSELPPSSEYGDPRSCVIFTLDGVNYAAVEDPSDGYRSYLESLEVTSKEPDFKFPPQRVNVTHCARKENGGYSEDCDIWIISDAVNGKPVLEVGTDNHDDYYPMCVMHWTPENMDVNSGVRPIEEHPDYDEIKKIMDWHDGLLRPPKKRRGIIL